MYFCDKIEIMCIPSVDVQAILLCMMPTLALAFTFNGTYAILFAMACIVSYFVYVWGCYTIQDMISNTVELYMQKEMHEDESFSDNSEQSKDEESKDEESE